MNLGAAPQRAESAAGPREAARLYADIESELSLGDYDEEQADAGEQALQTLEERFPGVRQASNDVVAYGGHLPNLSRSAGQRSRGQHRDDTERDAPAAPRDRRGSPRRGAGSGRRHGTAGGRSRSRSGSGSSARRSGRSSGPGLHDLIGTSPGDFTNAAIMGIRLVLLLGLGYFLLTDSGAGAFRTVLGAIGGGVGKVIDPSSDILPVGKSSGKGSSSSSQPVTPQSTRPGPASSIHGPSTPKHPSMFGDPFSTFPPPAHPSPFPAPTAPGVSIPPPRQNPHPHVVPPNVTSIFGGFLGSLLANPPHQPHHQPQPNLF